MANWLTHLRISQAVIDKIDSSVDEEKYYIGTIAPDGGKIHFDEKGKKYYEPPRYISHWTDNISDWDRTIHYERFYDKYVKNETDYIKKSFYLGYYIHLLTDALWVELVDRPIIENFETIEEFKSKAMKQFKDDWYNTELEYLKNNPNYYPLKVLSSIKKFDNIYLDYASSEAIQEKIERTLNN